MRRPCRCRALLFSAAQGRSPRAVMSKSASASAPPGAKVKLLAASRMTGSLARPDNVGPAFARPRRSRPVTVALPVMTPRPAGRLMSAVTWLVRPAITTSELKAAAVACPWARIITCACGAVA